MAAPSEPNSPQDSSPGKIPPLRPPRPSVPSASGRQSRLGKSTLKTREELGLSTLRPSQIIKGLDQAAARAEKAALREEAKRKGGGGVSKNVAVLTDGTGARWARNTRLLIAAFVIVGVGTFGILYWRTSHPPIDPRTAAELTRQRLFDLAQQAKQMASFETGEEVTIQAVQERLTAHIDDEIKAIGARMDLARQNGRPPDIESMKRRDALEALKTYKDGFDQPITLSLPDADTLKISSTGKPDLEPITVKIRSIPDAPRAQPQ